MPIHHIARLCTSLAISGATAAARRNRELNQQPTIVIQQTNQPNQPIPGEGYLPGYQPFTNQPTTVFVGAPQPVVVQPANIKPDSYMVFAILATVFCFFPFGIPAIVYSSQVDPAYESGDYCRAHSSSTSARGWVIAAFITGIICYCLAMFFFFTVINIADNDYE